MTLDQMKQYLIKIQEQSFENKILNVLLTAYSEIKQLDQKVSQLEKLIIELQEKSNQIIQNWNKEIQGVAEPVNEEEDLIEDYTGAADQGE